MDEDSDAEDSAPPASLGLDPSYAANPSFFLGEGYAAPLPEDIDATSQHAQSKQLTAKHWQDIVPALVLPFLRWCERTKYGRVNRPPLPCSRKCACEVQARNIHVKAVYGERV